MIVGENGPGVVISAETAYFLETYCEDISRLRVRTRGRLPHVAQELLDLRHVGMAFDPSRLPEAEADIAELAAPSNQWLTPQRVADLLGMSDRGVRLACSQGRIDAQHVGTRWRISQEAFQTYKAARAA